MTEQNKEQEQENINLEYTFLNCENNLRKALNMKTNKVNIEFKVNSLIQYFKSDKYLIGISFEHLKRFIVAKSNNDKNKKLSRFLELCKNHIETKRVLQEFKPYSEFYIKHCKAYSYKTNVDLLTQKENTFISDTKGFKVIGERKRFNSNVLQIVSLKK